MRIGTVFCIDGSGNKDQRTADRKRPVYRLDCASKRISRPLLADASAAEFFLHQVTDDAVPRPIMIATDVPLGLPAEPSDVLKAVRATSFLSWLLRTDRRLKKSNADWRTGLIASGATNRKPERPFVSIQKGDKIGPVRAKRRCDEWSHGESVYCVDHGGKQVGKAALQFWFDVLLPLRKKLKKRLAIWPFQAREGRDVVIAECYPAECQRLVYGKTVHKRQLFEVANALSELSTAKDVTGIDINAWVFAASSEDEFDMFTTVFAFRAMLDHPDDFFWYPEDHAACLTVEGWMLGLRAREGATETCGGNAKVLKAAGKSPRAASKWTQTGSRNRHGQENLGPAGTSGPKGPLYTLKCTVCGHTYTTNAQDIFQKKCERVKQHSN